MLGYHYFSSLGMFSFYIFFPCYHLPDLWKLNLLKNPEFAWQTLPQYHTEAVMSCSHYCVTEYCTEVLGSCRLGEQQRGT